jgi:predicted MFS family arabinose efflux permease
VPLLAAPSWRARSTTSQSRRSAIRRLGLSRFVSMAGTDATGVAIGFALYAATRSAAVLSLSLLLTTGTGALLAPLGGRVGDLLDRRRLMIAAELAAAAVFVSMALFHSPIALLALGLLAAAIGTIFGPASGAAVAHVAGERELTWASSVIATSTNVGKTAGRLLAGALIAALGVTSVFVLDAITFLLSAWLIYSVRRAVAEPREQGADAAWAAAPERAVGAGAGGGAGTAEVAGAAGAAGAAGGAVATDGQLAAAAPAPRPGMFSLLRRDRTLRLLVASACISTFATAFTMTAEVPLVFELEAGALGLGALTACWGVGMVVGSWRAGRMLHSGNEATGLLVGRLAMAAGVGLVAVSPSLGPMLACYLLGGFGGGFLGVASQSLVMRSTPDHLRAQTLGAIESCRNMGFGAGVIGAGAAVTVMGARPVYALVGVTMAIGAIPIAALVVSLGGLRPLRPAPAS